MALSISGNLVIDEEFRDPSTGSPDNEVTALSADATLNAYLTGLNSSPDTGFPQYAERDDMIVGSANGATLSLVATNTGTSFSTTTGILTGFSDIDGDAISLYQADATHPNVIVGKDAGGEVAFAIVLDGSKVYVIQYEALFHTGTGQVDSADTHDLTGLIFVQATSTTTTTLNFSDFRDVPSGQDEFAMIAPDTAPAGQQGAVQFLVTGVSDTGAHSTVNVSTQGGFNGSLGTGAQSTGVNESLIFDLVTGGDVTISNTESHNAANIDFATHVAGIREAGFGIVQTNPTNASVDVLLTAYNVKAATDTTDGTAFIAASLDPGTQDRVTITSVKIINKLGVTVADTSTNIANLVTFNINGSVTLNNLKDDWLVDFKTSGADLDRFVVKNSGTGNEQFDIGRLSATSSSSSTTKEYADLGAHLIYEDDGPLISLAINPNAFVVVDESIGQNPGEDESVSLGAVTVTGAVLFTSTIDAGADQLNAAATTFALSLGSGESTDSGLDDTATGQNIVLHKVSDTLVEGHVGTTAGALALSVAINSSGDVTLTQYRAVFHDDPSDPDEPGTSAATFSAGALKATETVADKDGDPATSNTVDLGAILRIEDDGPAITVNDIANANYGTTSSGTWSELPGTDGFKSLDITLNSYTIDSHSSVTVNSSLGPATVDGDGNYVFNGSITGDFTDDGVANNQTVNFKLTFDATPPGDNTYSFEVTQAPASTTTISTANGSLGAGGPDPVQTLTIGTRKIVFSAVDATAPETDIKANLDKTEGDIQTTPLPDYLSLAQMNVSTAGIGLGNNNFDGNATAGVDGAITQGGAFDESFVVDPTSFLVSSMKVFIDNSVGGYNPATEGVFYKIYYADGTSSGTTKVGAADLTSEAGGQKSFLISSVHNANDINAAQLFMGSGTVKIPVIEFNISEAHAAQSLAMNLTATITDNDNDTKSDAFSVAIA
jgi:hypothetical protein